MDDLDHAQQVSELMLNIAIQNARPNGRALRPKGRCHFCETSTELKDQLFCDIDCSDDWEKLQRKLRNQPV